MELTYTIRVATLDDAPAAWNIIKQGIEKRRAEGSAQWQDGYPNLEGIKRDISKQHGYVITQITGAVVAYIALQTGGEPVYEVLQTGWLTTNKPYLVIHRLAITQQPKIKGLAFWIMQQAEIIAKNLGMFSIRADTNFDNAAMLHLFTKLNYVYAGQVYFRGSARQAFEKVL